MMRKLTLLGGAIVFLSGMSLEALANLKLCNNTDSRVGVALGYKNTEGWATEGWWTVEPQKCLPLLKGNLIARYYYVFAVDYDKGGSWGGKSMMCTQDKEFTIPGIEDCETRKFTKTGFFEVDTGEQADWTVSLSGEKTTQGQ